MIMAFSCKHTPSYGKPVYEASRILNNPNNLNPYLTHLRLSKDFTALDSNYQVISKGFFLKSLATGRYLPLWLKSDTTHPCYQLIRLKDSSISLKQLGQIYYKDFSMEGKQLPGYNYVDIKGNIYNKETTKGKTLVINCWFVGCTNCMREMPALNALVKQYKNRKEILFLGLAMDNISDLNRCLATTKFDYQIIPLSDNYFMNVLNIQSFPKNIIVDKNGKIIKMLEGPRELVAALNERFGINK